MGLLMNIIADKVLTPEEKHNSGATIAMAAADVAVGAAIMAKVAEAGLKDLSHVMEGGGAVMSASGSANVPGSPAQGKGGINV